MRIAIAGFQHETNTFAPSKATYADFERGGGWPPLQRGGEIFETMIARNLPIAGFIEHIKGTRHTTVPTVWAATEPSAHVTTDAFERIAAMIVDGVRDAAPDAVYLDLHGAMVTEHLDDGEGELLARVRRVVGEKTPVVASLDLHANVTQRMLQAADALIAYRTYPHIDMAETGARTAHHLLARFEGMPKPALTVRRIPFLIGLSAQCTMLEPARSAYQALARLESATVSSVSFTPGFPAADFPECGPVVWAYGRDASLARGACDALADRIEGEESAFDAKIYGAHDAVRRAMSIAERATRPVVIADTQDNPGAGGNSDTTGMLRALIDCRAQRAAIGILVDADAAVAAHRAGIGRDIDIELGGKSHVAGDGPLRGRYRVEALSDGKLTCTGPFYRGSRMDLGLSAQLRIDDIRIVLASRKTQLADQALYRYVGIEPTAQAILVNKSSVHFRADFAPIAEAILIAKAPGPMIADPSEFQWKRLAPGIRLKPNGPAFK
ncbi:MAG: M81 family metallopeptidase [Burkholderiales bacterium]